MDEIRTATSEVDSCHYVAVPKQWECQPVVVIAGLPEGVEIKRRCDVPKGWEIQNARGEWFFPFPHVNVSNWTGLVFCRPTVTAAGVIAHTIAEKIQNAEPFTAEEIAAVIAARLREAGLMVER